MGFFNKFISKKKEIQPTIANILEQDEDFKKLTARNKKGDEQFDRINKETQLSKETGDITNLIKVYEDIILNEGLCFRGNSYLIALAELYYKAGEFDKAWAYLSKLGRGSEHAEIMHLIRDVQVKILKKEEMYIDALIFQMAALFYQNINGTKPTDKKIESKLHGLVKKCNLEDQYDYILYLIFNAKYEVDLRHNFKEMLKVTTATANYEIKE